MFWTLYSIDGLEQRHWLIDTNTYGSYGFLNG